MYFPTDIVGYQKGDSAPAAFMMLGSIHSHQDPHEVHLRHLLDQRAARADIHSPLSVSEFPDSPSVYSHPYFSPRQEYKDETDTVSSAFSVPRSRRSSASELSTSLSSRDILNNTAASILDLDDDSNSSIVSQTAY